MIVILTWWFFKIIKPKIGFHVETLVSLLGPYRTGTKRKNKKQNAMQWKVYMWKTCCFTTECKRKDNIPNVTSYEQCVIVVLVNYCYKPSTDRERERGSLLGMKIQRRRSAVYFYVSLCTSRSRTSSAKMSAQFTLTTLRSSFCIFWQPAKKVLKMF